MSSVSESEESGESYSGEEEREQNVSEHSTTLSIAEVKSRVLSHSEASECLCTLGKCDSGLKYAFLVMDASGRHLSDVSIIPTFKNILRVNVSGNNLTIESLQVLSSMSFLLMLEADRNGLTGSPRMDPMPYLQVLTMNRNHLSDTEGIFHPLLETLELNYNRIVDVTLDAEILKRIKVLELRGNILSTTNGIYLPSLVHLYIADNEIDRIEGLEYLMNLKILHLRNNRLSSLYGFQKTSLKLSYLNLRNNKIIRISELRRLENLKGLETLVVLGNLFIDLFSGLSEYNDGEERLNSYRMKVLMILPNLRRIDKDPVLEDERREAVRLRKEMLEDGMSLSEFYIHDMEGEE